MSVYVIGHRNPDTDAICAAIGYADLLRQTTRPDAIAAACGAPNSRTEFVLERAGIEPPKLIMDVRPTSGSLCRRAVLHARQDETVYEVYQRMRKHRLRSLPVVDEQRRVIGMLSLMDLLHVLLPDGDDLAGHRNVSTSLARVRSVLGGKFQHEIDTRRVEDLTLVIGAMNTASFEQRLQQYSPDGLVIIAGNRPSIQRPSIEYGVRALIISGGFPASDEVLEGAKAAGVTVLSSPLDTAMTILLVKSAKLIGDSFDPDVIRFAENIAIDEIRSRVHSTSQTLFPVVGDECELLGVFSKSDLIEPRREQLILVDHNEYGQAVTGAEEADVLEVIDHHRIGGGLHSREPIRFLNDTVGSTCTIITRMYRERAIAPGPGVALCLASGIISDTLYLTSPTTTDVDRELLGWLEPYTNVDLEEYAKEFFAAGSALRVKSPEEVLTEDSKAYEESGWSFSIAQIEELGLDLFWERKEDLESALARDVRESVRDFGCLMITDITQSASLLLVSGDERIIEALDYPRRERALFELSGIVSRKKQLLPHIARVLARLPRE